jgi:eukaryotic-like serine/threonine-protein kinase
MATKHHNAVAGDELLPGLDVGGYIIHSKIGEGGMGIVYAAMTPGQGARVAIKVLGPTFCRDQAMIARFEQEAQLINGIHHPNIVEIYNLGALPDGRKYIVMELLEGESLSDKIERGPVPPRDAIEIIDAMCDALMAVHGRSIIHRDLKSDNVFIANIGGYPRVKLLDFGLAKLSGNNPSSLTKTKTGFVVGTPQYLAPEQIRGKPADERTDVYSLGILSYKILVGTVPWDGNPTELLIHHLKTPPPLVADAIPQVPPALSTLVARMMAKTAEERPTLHELRAGFAALRASGAQPAQPHPSQSQPQTGRPAWVYLLIALGVLASAGISFAIVTAATG